MTTLVPKFQQNGTGAVNRAINLKLAETVSITDFGAVGDGTTDNTAAIQAALDYAAISGGTVIVPAGYTYAIAGNLSVEDTVSVCLVGQGNTTAGAGKGSILKFTGSAGTSLIDARSSYGFMLSNIYINQTNAAFAGVVVNLGHSTLAMDAAYAIIKENIFSTAAAVPVIDVTKAIIITIENNNFSGGSYAIRCSSNYANVININKNAFRAQTQMPISNVSTGSTNWNIVGNTFEPLSTGAAGAFSTTGLVGLNFTGNYCGDTNTTGTWITLSGGCAGGIIASNSFGYGAYGISSTGTNQALLISSNSFSNVATSDILITGATTYGDITNNYHYLSTAAITGTVATGRYMSSSASGSVWRGSNTLSSSVPNGIGFSASELESGVLFKINSSGSVIYPLVIKGHVSQSVAVTEWRDSTETAVARVAANGNLTNTNNSYGAISDKTLKENIVAATPKLDDLMKVQVKTFNFISDETKAKQIGVIAQEIETVFPSIVETDNDGIKSVKYSVLVPMLVKAIQELKAEVDLLKAH
jgi:hypothetical protein